MVGLDGVGCHHNEDPRHYEKVVDNGPPRIGGETISGLDLSDDRCDEGNNPCQLERTVSQGRSKNDHLEEGWGGERMGCRMQAGGGRQGWAGRGGHGVLTAEIEMVARANGSPIMLPPWMPRRRYCLLFSILRRDGEWSEP